jgi:hypothetical protein
MSKPGPAVSGDAAGEFEGLGLSDRRLDDRLERIVKTVMKAPSRSLPELFREPSQLEAAYRFFNNESVTPEAILEPHIAATSKRIANQRVIRVAHDTVSLSYRGDREGLGTIEKGEKGFLCHFALAVGDGESRVPLGVLGLHPFRHLKTEENRKLTPAQKQMRLRKQLRSEKESARWEALALTVQQRLPAGVEAIHVMDQEADDYGLFAALLEGGLRFVVRGWNGRMLEGHGSTIAELMQKQPAQLFRSVKLNRRPKRKSSPVNPPREEREAELQIRWAPISLQRPTFQKTEMARLSLWVVHIFEPRPPAGEEAIEWTLLTSEPVTNLEQATAVVDHYRARWVIEEFFKALKTGCSVEKRQLTSYDGLLKVVAVFAPIAWHMLAIRSLARQKRPPPAALLFNNEQLLLLAALLDEHRCAVRLPSNPTAKDALLGLASLGGHLPRNGEPGWIVLGRGYEDFMASERVWRLARGGQRSDQS